MRRTCAALFAAALSFVFLVHPAQAQQPQTGFVLDRFDPSERGSDWFAGDSLDLRGALRPSVGIVGDYSHNPLVLYAPDGEARSAIVADQLFVHVGGSLVLADRLRVALDLPIGLYEKGTGGTLENTTFVIPPSQTVGDLRLSADVRLFGTYDDLLTIAAGVAVYFPSGSRDAFTSDGSVRAEPRLLAAGRAGPIAYAARIALDYRGLNDSFAGQSLGSDLVFAASAGIKVAHDKVVLGPEIFGSTNVSGSDAFDTAGTPVEGLLGGHFLFATSWRAGVGAGAGLTRGFGSPAERVVASLEWAPPGAASDRDADGIADDRDACPGAAGIPTDDPKTNGCPPPPDGDHDRVLDPEDACPDLAGVGTGDPRTSGCPSDRDHDAIVDESDACPDVAGVRSDDPKTNGCPAPPSDRDKDGVTDPDDACPDVPGLKTSNPKTNGCPSDRDGDGVIDTEDACPDDAGNRDPDPTKNGCPRAIIREGQIRILDQVKFRSGSAELDPASDPVLSAVLKVLSDHPELHKIRIEGHTDNRGGAANNKKLSEGRAASVLAWLVAQGVAKGRLTSVGFGQTRPLDSNKDENGRRNNRRVEFYLVADPAHP